MKIEKLLSSEQIDRLIFLGRVVSDAQWEIGRMTISILDAVDKHNETHKNPNAYVGYMDVYRFVSQLTGKRDRSIRRYVAACHFYSPATVEVYDVLPFEYFAEAMAYPSRWKEMLDAALRAMDTNGGKLPGVTWMSNLFTAVNHEDQAEELSKIPVDVEQDVRAYEAVSDALVDRLEKLVEAREETYSVQDSIVLLAPIYKVIELIKEQIAKLPVTTEAKVAAFMSIDHLVTELEEIKGELENCKIIDAESSP